MIAGNALNLLDIAVCWLCLFLQRTSFAGMKQKDVHEYGGGGVAFDVLLNESIFRIAFCTDVNK